MAVSFPRFRYSLRALLIVTVLAGFAFAWVHQARRQRAAVESLRKSNPGVRVLYTGASLATGWSRGLLDDNYGASVIGVYLSYATDADLECLAHLSRVEVVELERSIDLTDEGLLHLTRLKYLRRLTISDAEQVTDAGLRHLESLTTLEYLQFDLGRHPVRAESLRSLRRALPNCRIEVGGTQNKELVVARSGASCSASPGRAGG